jgi:hypothetical protein
LIAKAAVLYLPATLLNVASDEPKGAVCGKCMMFLTDTSECSILDPPEVDGERGVCGFFVGGRPMTSKDHPPMMVMPAAAAGYVEDGPTRCGNCGHFIKPNRCAVVRGSVEADGCCNAWKGNNG